VSSNTLHSFIHLFIHSGYFYSAPSAHLLFEYVFGGFSGMCLEMLGSFLRRDTSAFDAKM